MPYSGEIIYSIDPHLIRSAHGSTAAERTRIYGKSVNEVVVVSEIYPRVLGGLLGVGRKPGFIADRTGHRNRHPSDHITGQGCLTVGGFTKIVARGIESNVSCMLDRERLSLLVLEIHEDNKDALFGRSIGRRMLFRLI